MSFTPLTTDEIQAGKPIRQELMQKIKDSLDALYTAQTSVSTDNVKNGNFQTPSADPNIPIGWDWSAYPSGAIALDQSAPIQGDRSVAIHRYSGLGNGGGVLSSDYIPCSPLRKIRVATLHKTDARLWNQVSVRWYTAALVLISETFVYDDTAQYAASRDWLPIVTTAAIPPGTARYFKVALYGARPHGTYYNIEGYSRWDSVSTSEIDVYSAPFNFSGVLQTYQNPNVPVTIATMEQFIPAHVGSGSPLTWSIPMYGSMNSNGFYGRVKVGSLYSSWSPLCLSNVPVYIGNVAMDISTIAGSIQLLEIQIVREYYNPPGSVSASIIDATGVVDLTPPPGGGG